MCGCGKGRHNSVEWIWIMIIHDMYTLIQNIGHAIVCNKTQTPIMIPYYDLECNITARVIHAMLCKYSVCEEGEQNLIIIGT